MKKKIWSKIATLTVLASMFLSVGAKAEDGKPVRLDESQWTAIYLDYLNSLNSDSDDPDSGEPGLTYERAELVYLNYDDIPEILLQSDPDEKGGLLISIEGEDILKRNFWNISSETDCYYEPHANLFRIVEKKSRDYSKYEEKILSTKDGDVKLLFWGERDSVSYFYYDEDNTKVQISNEEYWDMFDEAYGYLPQKTIRGYSYSLEDLMDEFEKRRDKFIADKMSKEEAPGWRQIYLDYLSDIQEDGSYDYEDNLIFYLDQDKIPEIILHGTCDSTECMSDISGNNSPSNRGKDTSEFYIMLTSDGKYLMEKRIDGSGLYKVDPEEQKIYFSGASDDGNYDKVFKLRSGFIIPRFDGVCYEENAGSSSKKVSTPSVVYKANGISMTEKQYYDELSYLFYYRYNKIPERPYSVDDLISLLEDPEAEIPGLTLVDAE